MHIMKQSLYERIGGKKAIGSIVEDFYRRVIQDPLLKPFFENMDMERITKKQIAFLTFSFGGNSEYAYWEKGIRNVHIDSVKNGLGDHHFDSVVLHLVESLKELLIREDMVEKERIEARNIISEVVAIVESTRRHVLNR